MKSFIRWISVLALIWAQASQAVDMSEIDNMLKDEQFDSAINKLRKGSQTANAQAKLAEIFLELDDLDGADKWISRAIKAEPNNAAIQHLYGTIMGEQAQNSVFSALRYAKKSRKAFIRATEIEPGNAFYLNTLIEFYIFVPAIAGGDSDLAASGIETMRKLDPVQADILEANFLWKEEKDEEADALFNETLQKYPNDARVLLLAGVLRRNEDDLEGAIQYLARAAAGPVSNSVALENARLISLYQLGRTAETNSIHHQQGIAAFETFLEQAPFRPALPSKEWARFRLANLLKEVGEIERAKSLYAQISDTHDERLQDRLASL